MYLYGGFERKHDTFDSGASLYEVTHLTAILSPLYSKFLNDCCESLHLFWYVLSTVISPFINLTALEESRICGKVLSTVYIKIHVSVIEVIYMYVGFEVCSTFLS